jgi:hypothetical protein
MTTTGLQCPSCGHIHPLADVAGQGRFRCAGCNRLLSVPEAVVAPPAADGEATRAHPAATPRPADQDRRAEATAATGVTAAATAGAVLPGPAAPVPAVVRVLVWVLSLALGFAVSAALLRVVGLLDIDAVLDAFSGEGVGRYSVLLVLLPLWAVLSAGAAHLVLEWAGRRRERRGRRGRRGPGDAGKSEKAQSRKDEGARRAV